MPSHISTAPAKTILFGEHSVVYGQPAIAIPVNSKKAKVVISPMIGIGEEKIIFSAPQINFEGDYSNLEPDHPFKVALDQVMQHLEINHYPACTIKITSSIPISSGLGSSAAISVALTRALFSFVGYLPTPEEVSNLAYQIEVQYHGNPSGIDNSVIAFEKPVYYQKSKTIEFLEPGRAFDIIIADSGIQGNTKQAVASVRTRWESDKPTYDQLFQEMGLIAKEARTTIQKGSPELLGKLMTANQGYLQTIGVSHPKLESLIDVSIKSGAFGAKLCGGGLGGNIVVLSDQERINQISEALLNSGAKQTIIMNLKKDENG